MIRSVVRQQLKLQLQQYEKAERTIAWEAVLTRLNSLDSPPLTDAERNGRDQVYNLVKLYGQWEDG
jgi:hypothetical protein